MESLVSIIFLFINHKQICFKNVDQHCLKLESTATKFCDIEGNAQLVSSVGILLSMHAVKIFMFCSVLSRLESGWDFIIYCIDSWTF